MPPWNTPWNPPWSDPDLPAARTYVRANGLAAALGIPGLAASLTVAPGWTGASLALLPGCVLAVLVNLRPVEPWIRNLSIFGLTAGLTELATDAWLVHGTRTLVYPPDEPQIWASPVYMPIAWLGMLGFGQSAVILASRRLSKVGTALFAAVTLGVYIPIYEAIAASAGWWHYVRTPMLGPVPAYILLGEALLALSLPWAMDRLSRCGPAGAITLGVMQGIWIGLSYGLAYRIVG